MAVHLNFCTIIFSPLSDLTFKVTFDEKEYTWGTKMVNKLSHAAVMWVGPFLPMVTVFHHETIKAVLSTGGRLSKFYSRPFQKIPLFIIFWAQYHGYKLIKESALAEAGNSVLTPSVLHWLAGNFGLCGWVLHVYTRHSTTTQLAQKFGTCLAGREW